MSESGGESYEYLVPLERYLSSGIRLGTKLSNKYLRDKGFIYAVRPDGLQIFDIRKIDERLKIAAKFIARYPPDRVLVHTTRPYGFKPIEMFCKFVGCKYIAGRFTPGTLTNPYLPNYTEVDLLIVVDPKLDSQAVKEAASVGIPVVALVDTDTPYEFIDLMIPCNNKGRRSLALIFWILARQVLRERGELKPDQDLPAPPEEFETKFVEAKQ
ncbi:MAG: 30S ribosomal protein S2 [Thermoproteus sp. AZ2]|jgi:small subunit ribosomal protein S2|uniref:30S ribosomal protein S2 n=1 Tax=Thermoproteus sp. AZ2 TaxID=1609232 RepID=A0ACC6UYS3_9CREN|nr:MAG: 30S ribosomal protein S2 [Thermoproteus sp. AZ2]